MQLSVKGVMLTNDSQYKVIETMLTIFLFCNRKFWSASPTFSWYSRKLFVKVSLRQICFWTLLCFENECSQLMNDLVLRRWSKKEAMCCDVIFLFQCNCILKKLRRNVCTISFRDPKCRRLIKYCPLIRSGSSYSNLDLSKWYRS